MNFSIGIVGLPNVGKSTLFKALTQNEVDISNYPPNVGIVEVPDERLNKIAEIIKPSKTTPTIIEFVDIAGLVKDAHKGEGLGNKFLAHIREVDAIVHVIRSFMDKNIKHIEEDLNPQRDIDIINTELIMKDLEILEKYLQKIEKEIKANNKTAIKESELLQKIKKGLNNEKLISQLELTEKEKNIIKHLNFLTIKPVIYLVNSKETEEELKMLKFLPKNIIPIDLKMELELSELSKEEVEELKLKKRIDILIKTCYKILNLITFYTIKGAEEARAWTGEKGILAPQAGGKVHSDFEEKFIRAEVINYIQLIKYNSWPEAKNKGLIEGKGKNYIVSDGDIIEFKI